MRLFKYFPPDRTDVLRDRKICFSSPMNLNDPFEMRPTVQLFESDEILRMKADASMDDRIQEALSTFPPHVRAQFTPAQLFMMRENVLATLPRSLGVHLPEIRERLYQGMAAAIGMLCLTERQDDILMWAHYACAHEGFVIEFDPSSSFFNQRRSGVDEFRHLRQVVYSKERPSLVLDNTKDMSPLLTKSDHWAYEREWRMLVSLGDASNVITHGSKNFHLFDFPAEAIVSITLGCRTSDDKSTEIRGILSGNSHLSRIPVYKSAPDENLFKLNILPA